MYNIQAPAKYPVHFQVNIVCSAANVQKVAASRVLIPVLMCGSPTKNGLGNGNTITNHTIISYIIIFLIPWKWKDAFLFKHHMTHSSNCWARNPLVDPPRRNAAMTQDAPQWHDQPWGHQWNIMSKNITINETSSNINETPWHSQLFTLKNAKKNLPSSEKKTSADSTWQWEIHHL